MAKSLASSTMTPQDALSVIGRPKVAKVVEPSHRPGAVTPDDSQADTRVSELLLTAAKVVHGKLESAAVEVGKDRANFTRDAKKWAAILEGLGPAFLSRFGEALVNEYGPVTDPISRALQLQQEINDRTAELVSIIVGSAA